MMIWSTYIRQLYLVHALHADFELFLKVYIALQFQDRQTCKFFYLWHWNVESHGKILTWASFLTRVRSQPLLRRPSATGPTKGVMATFAR